jgi:predicted transposase/invertase (TIGR01784 family)
MDTAIQKAQERITFVAQDKESLRAYEMREMALSDFTSGMNFARREGRREADIKYTLKLAQRGMNVVEIADFTDLSIEEVKKIIKNAQ